MSRDVYLLDCTLRDGGFALEGRKDKKLFFTKEDQINIMDSLVNAGIDIIELGTLEKKEYEKKEYAIYSNMNEIREVIERYKNRNSLFAVFFRGPDIPMESLPKWDCEIKCLIRLGVRYSEMDKSLEYCKGLCEKGYFVSIQPIVTNRYSDMDLDKIIYAANKMNAYSLYFVDSYGAMLRDDIKYIFQKYDKELNENIKIGFHGHNNMGLAASNVIDLLSINSKREVIVDSCCIGMGQGAGNLQTEVIASILNKTNKKKYSFTEIMKACDIVSSFWNDNLWGYSLSTMIPAVYGVAYKYGLALRNEYSYSYEDISNILSTVGDEIKHQFTKDNLEKILIGMDRK